MEFRGKRRTVSAAVVLAGLVITTAFARTWLDDGGWWYLNEDGSSTKNGWQQIENKWYYFDEDGYMLADTTIPDGYRVGADGAYVREVSSGEGESGGGTAAGDNRRNIKGIQMVFSSKPAVDLRVGHAAWNVRINDSGDVLDGNQDILRKTKAHDIRNAITIHNPWHTDEPNLMPVEAPTGAVFYGYNVRTEEGRAATRRAEARVARSYRGACGPLGYRQRGE